MAAGLAVGVLGSLGLGRVLGSLLFGVAAGDPLTMAAVVLMLTAVAALATYVPARQATQVDPARSLREG